MQDFGIDSLLHKLKADPEGVLRKIDADELLNHAEHPNGLVIANASKALFTPEEEHHLYAKGIVYKRDPYRLVSLPLLKIYNYGEKELVNELTDALAEQSDLRITLPVKEDGFMAQLFEHEGHVYATTRSVLEGSDTYDYVAEKAEKGQAINYVDIIRDLAKDKYPALLDPEVLKGKTVVCEAIHSDMENGITWYDDDDLVVIAVFDLEAMEYWSNDRVIQWSTKYDLEPVDYLTSDVSLEEAIQTVLDIEDEEHVPEGGVVCFEKEGRVVHRVKVKTATWFREHSLRYNCNLRSVGEMLWHNHEYHDWSVFKAYLVDEGLTSEETLNQYQEFHTEYMTWWEDCHSVAENTVREVAHIQETVDGGAKEIAEYVRNNYERSDFGLIMNCYRAPNRTLYDVMWQRELYRGIKGLIQEAKNNL